MDRISRHSAQDVKRPDRQEETEEIAAQRENKVTATRWLADNGSATLAHKRGRFRRFAKKPGGDQQKCEETAAVDRFDDQLAVVGSKQYYPNTNSQTDDQVNAGHSVQSSE